MFVKIIIKYWISEETNIFKNYIDAVCGFIVLVLVPAASIWLTLSVEEYTFWSYFFPLSSISLAGLYDTYGRYEGESPRNQKLFVRAGINAVAILLAAVCPWTESEMFYFISPVLLAFSGVMLLFEMYNRVKIGILISPWGLDV